MNDKIYKVFEVEKAKMLSKTAEIYAEIETSVLEKPMDQIVKSIVILESSKVNQYCLGLADEMAVVSKAVM